MAPPLVPWSRLVRFRDSAGQIRYGEPILPSPSPSADIAALARDGTLKVKVYEGSGPLSCQATDEEATVDKLLGPLEAKDVPLIYCIGLNYKAHILEGGRPLPSCPTIFIKGPPCIADHDSAIPIPKVAQAKADYEGEFCVVLGRDAKDVAESEALDYVAAYTCGNDVSARDWQREPGKAGPVPQWSFSKSFDRFAPMGPCLVAAHVLSDDGGGECTLRTLVNGEERQRGAIADLCFGVKQLIAFCSQGHTLLKGTVLMTGTPGGVGLYMDPPTFLKHGDQVDVEITGIGTLRNTIVFE